MLGWQMSNGRKAETKGPLYWGLFAFYTYPLPHPLQSNYTGGIITMSKH